MDLVIDTEFQQTVPPLQPDELTELEKSLVKGGCRDALVIWAGQNILLDGHHRYELCQKHNISFETVGKQFNSREDAMVWIIQNQFGRRNINLYQRSVLALKLEGIFARKARENQRLSEGRGKKGLHNCANLNPIDTREEVAKVARVSHTTIARAKKIKEKASPKQKTELETGAISINEAYRAIKSQEKLESRKASQERIADLSPLAGEYQVIVIDPPWPFNSRQSDPTHEIASPYEIKSIIEIKALNIPAAEDSVLWLWVPNAFLHDAFHVLEAWGFSYKTTLTWVKNKIGLGDWLRGQTEHCLIGVKGDYHLIPGNTSTVLFADSTQHSAKPDLFYELVEKLCPGNKADVFGRKKRDGWVIWGPDSENNNQVNWHKVAKVRNLRAMRVAVVNSSYYGMKPGNRIYNLGSDKIAQYHRLRGDDVVYAGPWVPMMPENRAADKVYFSVIFTWDIPSMIRQVQMVRDWGKEVEIGGPAATFMAKYIARETGIEPHCGLDERFEHIPPNMTGGEDYKLTFSQRGCPHHCAWCGVKKVEPDLLEYDDFPTAPMIGDNNILATSWEHQELVVNKLVKYGRKIDINSGFDVRFFHEEHKKLYSRLKLAYWRFAFDSMEVEADVRRVAAMMRANGLDRHQVTVYALIGFPGQTVAECLYRLDTLIGLGMAPYPMRFWPLNSLDRKYVAPGWTENLLQRMSMYYQTPNLWMADSWENFKPGKKIRDIKRRPKP